MTPSSRPSLQSSPPVPPPDSTLPGDTRQLLAAEALQWLQQGTAQFRQGQYMAALAILRQSLQAYRTLGDRSREARLLLLLSTLYYRVADYLWAVEYARQGLQVGRQIQDMTITQQALSQLGNSYRHLGDLAIALDYMTQSLTLARECRHPEEEMRALNNLAMVYRAKGLSRQAATLYEASLHLANRLGQPQTKLHILQNLGNTYLALKDYAAAIDYYEQFLSLTRQTQGHQGNNVKTRRRILKHLIAASLALGDQLRAVLHLTAYLRLVQRLGDSRSEVEVLKSLAQAYLSLGNFTNALSCQERRLQIALQLDNDALIGPAFQDFHRLCYQGDCMAKLTPYYPQIEAIGVLSC